MGILGITGILPSIIWISGASGAYILPFVDGGGKDMANLRRYYGQDFCFDKRSGNGYPKVVFAILIFVFYFCFDRRSDNGYFQPSLYLNIFIHILFTIRTKRLNQRKNAFLAKNGHMLGKKDIKRFSKFTAFYVSVYQSRQSLLCSD